MQVSYQKKIISTKRRRNEAANELHLGLIESRVPKFNSWLKLSLSSNPLELAT